jgi:hypothetical protein
MDQTFDISLTKDELDLLLHFAEVGYNAMYERNNFGDRAVVREFYPTLVKIALANASAESV